MNILILEDSTTISKIIEKTLNSYGYITEVVSSKSNISNLLKISQRDLIIMNIKLSYKSSFDLCSQIKQDHPKVYIIGIQNSGVWQDKIDFLQQGGDDCMNFPFPMQELVVRIQTIMRRPKNSEDTEIKYGNFKINPSNMQAFYKGKYLPLSKKEYNVLEYMMRNRKRPITRAELLDHVWDYKKSTGSNTVDVHIQKIRKKISSLINSIPKLQNQMQTKSSKHNHEIKTIHGIGYKLDTCDTYQTTDNFTNKFRDLT
ncbi:response regulator transcription factor [Candidatus Dojkabacteria bacterium]|nr:response regulator transcription factor [Candidatus Dojkabacteria bacterium]